MMKHLAYIASLLLMLCSCSEDVQPDAPGAELPDGTPIEITASAEFPEMNFGVDSRAFVDMPTGEDYLRNTLKVNILVFDAAGVMQQYIPPTDITIGEIDAVNHIVKFKVKNIFSSTQQRRLHFVVTSATDITRDFVGGELITAMANEKTVMPALVSKDNADVYWGLSVVEVIKADTPLEMKVIRNYVKLKVEITDNTSEFVMRGFTVVNRPSRGTVAPYIHSTGSFASFLTDDNATLQSYDNIIAQGYIGVNPAGADQSMTHTTVEEVKNALTVEGNNPCYFYERSQSEIAEAGSGAQETYVIVEGYYNGTHTFYKIDIGRDELGKYRFYDLLRNFEYTIQITEVGGPGASTVEEAMKGIAHNNLSSSVVMHDLFSISHDNEVIVVSATRAILTQKKPFELRFRYTVPSGSIDESQLKVYDLGVDGAEEYNMTRLPKPIDLPGEVIESASLSRDEVNNWYVLTITPNDIPTDARRLEQNIRIYYAKEGTANLGRSVTLMLQQPWQLDVSSTAPTAASGSACDIKFKLPQGLISSQFPLTLTFESDKQNIYAKRGSDMTVSAGKSDFKGATTDNVIHYEWNISWSAYTAKINAENEEDKYFTANFLMNTTLDEDQDYSTAGIDGVTDGNGNREDNDDNNFFDDPNSSKFCIRIADKGDLTYFEPFYVNITRSN